MLLVDGDADADGSDAAAAAGGRSGRRDCNIGQRLHSCFKLDLLKSFRHATPTGANWDSKYIFYRTVVHRALSFPFARYTQFCTCTYVSTYENDSFYESMRIIFLIFLMIIRANLISHCSIMFFPIS